MKYKSQIYKIVKLFLFAMIVLFLFIQLTYVYRGYRNNLSGYYAEKKDSLDVVILGTSSTFSAFMPMEIWGNYGIASYNMCTNVLFMDSMKYYIREIEKTQSPQLLIIDTAPFLYGHKSGAFFNEESHLRYNTDGLSISLNRVNLINAIIPKEKRTEFYFDLFYYHGNEDISLEYLFNKCDNEKKGYNNLPQALNYDENTYMVNTDIVELPEEENGYFIDLLEELKSFKGDVLFIEQPVFYTKELETQCGYSEYMENKVKEYGYAYLDLSKVRDDIGLDSQFDYSLDFLHFTAYSAELITDYVAQYISSNYDFADHRNDTKYQKWQEQYAEWIEIKEVEREQTENEIMKHFYEADLQQYIGYLDSKRYSSCIYVPVGSEVWQDEDVRKQLEKIGLNVTKEMKQAYFAVNDHSLNVITEANGNESLDFGSTFGHIKYDNLEGAPNLLINDAEKNYLEGNNGAIHIILVKKATGEIVDNVCFNFDSEQNTWNHKNIDK